MDTEGEIEFLRTYKDFIYHFNMLERNIGYCLRFCLTKKGNQNPERWLTASFDSKVKKIIALAKECGIQDTFSEWHAQVQESRHLRNIITHGSWEWKSCLPDPIDFHAPEIEDGKGTFTIKEFQEKLVFLKNISEIFGTIRRPLEIAIEKKAYRTEKPQRTI